MTLRVASCGAVAAVVLMAASSAGAAPIPPQAGVSMSSASMTIPVRFGWHDHPLMYEGNWREHQRQWDAFEGRSGRPPCARFRGYDRATHSYVNRNGRRVACR
jgi:hypothetical protein